MVGTRRTGKMVDLFDVLNIRQRLSNITTALVSKGQTKRTFHARERTLHDIMIIIFIFKAIDVLHGASPQRVHDNHFATLVEQMAYQMTTEKTCALD